MTSSEYDIVTVGGGLGSSALARTMAEAGYRVLIIEREREFRDRVRGELMAPWGVAEAKDLGIYELIRDSCGIDVHHANLGFGPRDLIATTPQKLPALGFYHPAMQEVVLEAARKAGAAVMRGATVMNVSPGQPCIVAYQDDEGTHEVSARLVVAADGRTSAARKWGEFDLKEVKQPFYFAGLLLEGVTAPIDHVFLLFLPPLARCIAMTPGGNGRSRAYVAYQDDAGFRLQGEDNVAKFLAEAKKAELLSDYLSNAKAVGPLASFRCGDFWVDHPYKNGIALVGDAASTSDPAFGQGLATTVRDVRVLRDNLLSTNNWEDAGNAYALEHDRYSAVVRKVEQWFRAVFLEQGVTADARRARALPKLAEDETRAPDHLFSGPDLPADESVKQRFFGEA